jgi:RimJ/RimL family protein N-acetyltransferase
MQIIVSDDLYLSPFTADDIPGLLDCLNRPEIIDNLLTLPFPYTKNDAEIFLAHNAQLFEKHGLHLYYAIRLAENNLMIGSIGLQLYNEMHRKHRAKVGYYLLPTYQGKGIMTRCLNTFTLWALHTFKPARISATIFMHNIASEKVALKCGYHLEATLLKYYLKNGKYIDTKLYTIINE